MVLVITEQETPSARISSFPEQSEGTEHHADAHSQAKHSFAENKDTWSEKLPNSSDAGTGMLVTTV